MTVTWIANEQRITIIKKIIMASVAHSS